MMKRWEYSGGWKALAIILNQICAVVLVLSVAVCSLYIGSSSFEWIGSKEDSFESTAYYQNEVYEQIRRCIRAASRESKFEKNGAYDAKLALNIEEYVDTSCIIHTSPEDDGLYYRLADLLNWYLDGYENSTLMKITYDDGTVGYIMKSSMNYTEQSLYEEGSVVSSSSTVYTQEPGMEEPYSEEEETVPDAGSIETEVQAEEQGEEDVYAELDPFNQGQTTIQNVEQIEAVEERYAPIGYASLVDYAEKNQLSTARIQELYNDLIQVISEIYNDFSAYKENLELFSPSMTNMRYLIIPKELTEVTEEDYEKKTYTNIKSFGEHKIEKTEDLLNYIRSHRDYLIFDSSDMSFEEHNMPVSLSDISSYLKGYQPSVEGDYILAVAVDPRYMASDNLQEYKRQYDEIRPVSRMAAYGVVLGSLLYLLTMVYLTLAAGRGTDEEDRTIRLNGYDRLKTETAFLVVGIPSVAILFVAVQAYNRVLGLRELGIFGGTVVFVLNLLFLVFYLSIVRRMKSRTLWTNSIAHSILEMLRSVMRNRKVTTKVVITYLCFLAGNGILLCFGVLGFLMALVLDFVTCLLMVQQALQRQRVLDGIRKISEGNLTYHIPLEKLGGDNLALAEAVNHIGEGLSAAVEQSVKDERLKTDLITNVSHDIKTPLTSIINYVDLLKREDIEDERARNYIAILEDKAQRLKHLTDDLVEASKISSGNVKLEFVRINFQELINQTNGEFSEKFEAKGLQLVVNMPQEPVIIEADGRRLWRIVENLYNNAAKYAMPRTRVYVDLTVVGHMVRFNIKNISEQPLNIEAKELTERFIRGDVARSTEGSGLGLSIAKNLTELQKGSFDIYLDGDLFKVTIIFPEAVSPEAEKEVLEAAEETKEEE